MIHSKQRITVALLKSLLKDKDNIWSIIRDTEVRGFGIRRLSDGSISYIYEGRKRSGSGRNIRRVIGRYPETSVADARIKALDGLKLLREGVDPSEKEKRKKAEELEKEAVSKFQKKTLNQVFEEYKKVRSLKARTIEDYNSLMDKCMGDWKDRPIREISPSDVQERFFQIQDRIKNSKAGTDGKAQATRTLRLLNALCEFAKVDEENGVVLLERNPCEIVKRKGIDTKIPVRERALSPNEIQMLLEELSLVDNLEYKSEPYAITNGTSADLIYLLLFTGLRLDEGRSLRWEDVSFENGYFVVRDTKNNTDHYVPMSKPVRSMLERRYAKNEDKGEFVFPSKRSDGHIVNIRKQLVRIEKGQG